MAIRTIVFLRESDGGHITPVNYYRALLPLRKLGMKDDRFDVTLLTQEDVRDRLRSGYGDSMLGYDLYVISRLFAAKGLEEFLEVIRNGGGKIVFDTDDDLTCDHRELGRGDEFKLMISAVDLVTVSTPYLSKKLEPYTGYRPPVLYNHVDCSWFGDTSMKAKREVPGLVIGFVGTTSHEGDWHYPVDALLRISEEFDNVTIAAAGYVPPYLENVENLVRIKPVPYVSYPRVMRQFDIVCCSLDPHDQFNLSKSAIKSLESMASSRVLSNGKIGGAVPVCTDMPVYRRCVNRKNGALTSNTGWYESIRELVEDEIKRNEMAEYGHKWVKEHRNIETGYTAWGKLYRSFVNGGNYAS